MKDEKFDLSNPKFTKDGHNLGVVSARFNNDGTWLAVSSIDSSIDIYELKEEM